MFAETVPTGKWTRARFSVPVLPAVPTASQFMAVLCRVFDITAALLQIDG